MTLDPAAYLTEALDHIQHHALKSTRLDWNAIHTEALTRIQDAQTTADTYSTLRWVLSLLRDRHSFLATPKDRENRQTGRARSLGLLAVHPEGMIVAVQPDSPAARAGLQFRDTIETINDTPVAQLNHLTFKRALHAPSASLTIRRAGQASLTTVILHAAVCQRNMNPHSQLLDTGIGYLDMPGVTGNKAILKAYVMAVRHLIRSMDRNGAHLWMIDLRRNVGGHMWPMFASVSALLGAGECGSFVFPEGKQECWLPELKKAQTWKYFGKPSHLKHPVMAIAVLTSHLTCSSGEYTTLAFRGHPQARSFGEATSGLSTATQAKTLRDGAHLYLTEALSADRTGRIYDGPIVPEQLAKSDWTLFQTEQDPVVLAAVAWLRK